MTAGRFVAACAWAICMLGNPFVTLPLSAGVFAAKLMPRTATVITSIVTVLWAIFIAWGQRYPQEDVVLIVTTFTIPVAIVFLYMASYPSFEYAWLDSGKLGPYTAAKVAQRKAIHDAELKAQDEARDKAKIYRPRSMFDHRK